MLIFLGILLISRNAFANLPPVFTSYKEHLVLSENTKVGSVVFTLKGFDPEGSPVRFGLQGSDKFHVDENSGEIRLIKPLDHEVNATLQLLVTIEDEVDSGADSETNKINGSGNNIVRLRVDVFVTDENDNQPTFLNAPYEVTVPEDTPVNKTIFRNIKVSDVDEVGKPLEVFCSSASHPPESCDIFSIKSQNSSENFYEGFIELSAPLDYAIRKVYQLVLVATDGTVNGSTVLEIKVKDVQNKPPVFASSLVGIVAEDASIGTLVMTVLARDGDLEQPREIRYELVTNPMDYFILDSESGQLRTARPLDKEALAESTGVITFKIRAYEIENRVKIPENGTETVALATVTIQDANDEPPKFNRREYAVEIPEDLPVGSPLPRLDMTVTDHDVGTNAVFRLRLDDDLGFFAVEPEGNITGNTAVTIRLAKERLDYENPNNRKFILLMVAEEVATSNRLSSTATVSVSVTDVNDNGPRFEHSEVTASINEAAPEGEFVTALNALDDDTGRFGADSIVYKLNGNGSDRFVMNKKTGVITVAACPTPGQAPCLDLETKSEYHFMITATDMEGAGLSAQASLRIVLQDANDNPPRFQINHYSASIDEGASKFIPPLKIKANDADSSGFVEYYINGGNEYRLFALDPHSGEITVNGSKLVVDELNVAVVQLVVQATDSKFSDTANVTITINDVNNNAPIFEQLVYELSIPENLTTGNSIFQIKAHDADSGDNAVIRYAVHSGTFDDFKLNNLNGVLMVSSKLDYDRKSNYSIIVLAMDSGVPSLTGTATINIKIIDSNDKSPVFTPNTQRAEISEAALIKTIVTKLKVHDPDATPGGLEFKILQPVQVRDSKGQPVNDQEVQEWFKVDSATGEVFVANNLTRNKAALFTIPLQVVDKSAPFPQYGKGMLIISIIDVNDHAPIFLPPWSHQSPRYHLNLPEGWTDGVLATYSATDADSSIDRYIIDPANEWFAVDAHSGAITLKKALDFEKEPVVQFVLWAIDTGVPAMSSSAIVTVAVRNLNDHDPVFSQPSYKAKVAENSPLGTLVTTVVAHDQDGGDYGLVSYSLVGSHAADFTINEVTGEIRVQNPDVLDREMRRSILLEVVAQDHGTVENFRAFPTTVEVDILDQNDNTPKFGRPSYFAAVMENLSVNPPSVILQVHADDPDLAENGTVRYSITKGNIEGAFRIDVETGIIYPAISLRGKPKLYSMVIQAEDGGGRTASVPVDITIQDVNEHRPVFVMPTEPNATIIVLENEAVPDFLVMSVCAKDEDSGDNGRVTYHFKVNNTDVQETEEFTIHKESGNIRIRVPLDREQQSRYSLLLVAKDHGKLINYEALSWLTISLKDVNDNQPEFSQAVFDFSVMENNHVGAVIGQIKAFDKDEAEENARIYYSIMSANDDGAIWLDRTTGILYANESFDREIQELYTLQIKASNDPHLFTNPVRRDLGRDPTMAIVRISILDDNDNIPVFQKTNYYVGVKSNNVVNELFLQVTADDPDLGENGTLDYFIQSSNLFKSGSRVSSGSVIPSPFNITKEGKIIASALMAEYSQDRFQLTVIARERAIPYRTASAIVHVWVIEPNQRVRVVLSRPPNEVHRESELLLNELSKATGTLVIIDSIRYHVDAERHVHVDWTDMYLHAASHETQDVVETHDILKAVDAQYDALKDSYAGFSVENILPAVEEPPPEPFDAALAALVALLVVLFVGAITFFVVCCCLRDWIITTLPSRHDLKKKDALIKQAMIEELHTTENPLWVEQKLKIYEEQELTMQVFMDSDLRNCEDNASQQEENHYATIQHNPRGSNQDDGGADYETLNGRRASSHTFNNPSSGFQGSTFQVPQSVPDLL